ncbi:lactate dehydrogenase a [Lichtheimia corymbifera JMRC:FSU:9682]|uniref:Lactate dehydrogenase a n=1 Tax=Lichtheimia corymbifera JMRC:FSU:9682 TaxID=1263082 RepID=A0A068RJF8_9FUNG|nr:lactate dehydrogenase a [Lichtheimia corymbifera JMRC:FSU:9682]
MGHSKVAIIGAGSVGTALAYALLMRGSVTEILLVDISTSILQGQVLDLEDAALGTNTIIRAGTFNEASQSDVIVITADAPMNPQESELKWVKRNQQLMSSILSALLPIQPRAMIVVGSDPVDVLTWQLQEKTGLPRHCVFGVGGNTRSTARARAWIAEASGARHREDKASVYVVGSGQHPVVTWHSAHINNRSVNTIPELADHRATLERIVNSDRGNEIARLKGGAWFGRAAMLSRVVEACLVKNNDDQLPPPVFVLSVYVDSLNACLSMPVYLTHQGAQEQVQLNLSSEEEKALKEAAVETTRLYETSMIPPAEYQQ